MRCEYEDKGESRRWERTSESGVCVRERCGKKKKRNEKKREREGKEE